MIKIIFATSNPEKLKEAQLSLAPFGYEVEGREFAFYEPYKGTMEDIAKIKLAQLDNQVDIPVFVDDSGIFFEGYNNFPGVITKRIFNMIGYKGIEKLLTNENRGAHFQGVVVLKWKDELKIFKGETYGSIIDNFPRNLPNNLKFPYDPIFKPEGSELTFAEMGIEEKLKYSYRRKALDNMGEWLKSVQILCEK